MVITNYATLVSSLQAIAEDDGIEFAEYIPNAVYNAEERLIRELDAQEIKKETTGTVTSSNEVLLKPDGFKAADYIYITNSGTRSFLTRKDDSFNIDFWPNPTNTGVPRYYSDKSSTEFRIVPTPSSNFSYTIKYVKEPTKLGLTNPTNYFITNAADVLETACMVELAYFMKEWNQVSIWENKYVRARDAWNLLEKRNRRDGLHVPKNPDSSGTNTIEHTANSAS